MGHCLDQVIPIRPRNARFSRVRILYTLPPSFEVMNTSLKTSPIIRRRATQRIIRTSVQFATIFSVLHHSMPFRLSVSLRVKKIGVGDILRELPILRPRPRITVVRQIVTNRRTLIVRRMTKVNRRRRVGIANNRVARLYALTHVPGTSRHVVTHERIGKGTVPHPRNFHIGLRHTRGAFPTIGSMRISA